VHSFSLGVYVLFSQRSCPVSFVRAPFIWKSLKVCWWKENELRSNGNREYLDDKTTIAAMLSSMSAYEVQLVLEPNETLDTDEIKFWILQVKINVSIDYKWLCLSRKDFEKKYRKINNIFPSDYATRGFDMTFDDAIGAE
jgi:hypothetical protein